MYNIYIHIITTFAPFTLREDIVIIIRQYIIILHTYIHIYVCVCFVYNLNINLLHI